MANEDKIRIIESYRDYVPPVNATAIVGRLLHAVPEKYLIGLTSIVLTNESSLSRRDRVGKVWSRKRKFEKSMIAGRYHPKSRGSLPWIELRVDKIIAGSGPVSSRIPFLQHVVFGHVLFHELGHHIHYTIKPEHKEKEDVADDWAGKMNAEFIRKHYWYLIPVLTPTAKCYKFMRKKKWI